MTVLTSKFCLCSDCWIAMLKCSFSKLAIFVLLLYHVPRYDPHVTVNYRHVTHVRVRCILRVSNCSNQLSLACFRSCDLHVTFELYGGCGMSGFTRQLPITVLIKWSDCCSIYNTMTILPSNSDVNCHPFTIVLLNRNIACCSDHRIISDIMLVVVIVVKHCQSNI